MVPKQQTKQRQEPAEQTSSVIDPQLALIIKDPLRAQIIAVAHQRAISPSEFSREHGHPLGAVSSHFRVLAAADYLELVDTIQVRGATKHMYRATRRAFVSAADWGQLSKSIQAGVSGAIFQDFNARVVQAMQAETFDARDDSCFLWLALVLDEISWPKFVEILSWAHSEVRELEVETAERRANGEAEGTIPATFAIAGFESPKESDIKRAKSKSAKKRSSTSGSTKGTKSAKAKKARKAKKKS